MRRVCRNLPRDLQILESLQILQSHGACSTAVFPAVNKDKRNASSDSKEGNSNSFQPAKKESTSSSKPISQLFSKLNLNIQKRPESRPPIDAGQRRQERPVPGHSQNGSDYSRQRESTFGRPVSRPRPQQPQRPTVQARTPEGAPARSRPPSNNAVVADPDDLDFDEPSEGQRTKQRRGGTGQSRSRALQQEPRSRQRPQAEVPAVRKRGPGYERTSQDLYRSRLARITKEAPPEIRELLEMENKFKLDPGEPMALLHPVTKKRIRSTRDLPISDEQLQKDFARAAVMERDPTVNINWGPPIRLPNPTLDEIFAQAPGFLMESFDIKTEEEWNEKKDMLLSRTKKEVATQKLTSPVRNAQDDQEILYGMRDSIPEKHPMRNHVNMVVHQLNRNPGWSFFQKHQYMTKLLREYVHKPIASAS